MKTGLKAKWPKGAFVVFISFHFRCVNAEIEKKLNGNEAMVTGAAISFHEFNWISSINCIKLIEMKLKEWGRSYYNSKSFNQI